MRDKLISQIAVHLSDTEKRQISGLAEITGQSASQYVRNLIITHLSEKRAQCQIMRDLFDLPENGGNGGNDG